MTVTVRNNNNRRQPLHEPPVKEITDIQETYPELSLRIYRRTPGGTIVTLDANVIFPTIDLLNGRLEKYLETKGGGGSYTIEGRDPVTIKEVIPRYTVTLQGAPRDHRMVPQQAVQAAVWGSDAGYSPNQGFVGAPQAPFVPPRLAPPIAYQIPGVATPQLLGGGQVSAPPPNSIPAWATAYPVEQQWKLYFEGLERAGKLPPGSSMHSDALANNYANVWQTQWAGSNAENAKLREQLVQAEKDKREVEARLLKQVEDLRVSLEAQKREGEVNALRSEIQALRDSLHNGSSSRRNIDWAALIAAGAPLATAAVTLLSERAKTAAMMDVEVRKLEARQQETMLATLAKPAASQTDWPALITAAGTLLGPMIVKYLENNSPTTQAELIDMRNTSQMMQMKMLHDIIQSYESEPEKPPWYPIAEALLRVVDGVGQKLATGALNRSAQAPALPGQPGNHASQTSSNGNDDAVWANLFQTDQQAAQLTKLVWDNLPPDLGFHSNEWRILLFNVHAKTAVDELAREFVLYLQHLERFNALPVPLKEVFVNHDTIDQLLSALPIAKDPATMPGADPGYVQQLSAAIKSVLRSTTVLVNDEGGADTADAPEEDDGAVEEQAVVERVHS